MTTILFAEDKLGYKKQVEDALRNAGFEVISVDNGIDALAELDTGKFDIVLTDYCMPGARGDEVAKKAKKKHVPRIIINSAMWDLITEIPGVDIVAKMSPSEAVDKVNIHYGRERSGR